MSNVVLEYYKQETENQPTAIIKARLSGVLNGIKLYQEKLRKHYPNVDFHFKDDDSLPLNELKRLKDDDRRNYTDLVGCRNRLSAQLDLRLISQTSAQLDLQSD